MKISVASARLGSLRFNKPPITVLQIHCWQLPTEFSRNCKANQSKLRLGRKRKEFGEQYSLRLQIQSALSLSLCLSWIRRTGKTYVFCRKEVKFFHSRNNMLRFIFRGLILARLFVFVMYDLGTFYQLVIFLLDFLLLVFFSSAIVRSTWIECFRVTLS